MTAEQIDWPLPVPQRLTLLSNEALNQARSPDSLADETVAALAIADAVRRFAEPYTDAIDQHVPLAPPRWRSKGRVTWSVAQVVAARQLTYDFDVRYAAHARRNYPTGLQVNYHRDKPGSDTLALHVGFVESGVLDSLELAMPMVSGSMYSVRSHLHLLKIVADERNPVPGVLQRWLFNPPTAASAVLKLSLGLPPTVRVQQTTYANDSHFVHDRSFVFDGTAQPPRFREQVNAGYVPETPRDFDAAHFMHLAYGMLRLIPIMQT